MGRNKKRMKEFDVSLANNVQAYFYYLDRLTELAISSFQYENLPNQYLPLDVRFLETKLCYTGKAVFFGDEDLGENGEPLYMWLQCSNQNELNVYGIPQSYRAYACNGYQRDLNFLNSVLIWNNLLHTPTIEHLKMFALRLWDLDRTIDINARAQKTPILLSAPAQQRLTLLNLYKEVDGNSPVIFGDDKLHPDALKTINTGAPFTALQIYELKANIWNEALTYLGIPNITMNKKERVVKDEVTRNQGGTIASRYSRVESRQTAFNQINEMFGLNIQVHYRDFSDDEVQLDGGELNGEIYDGSEDDL